MAKYKLEYLWLDGYEPVANIRGKTQIKEFKSFPKVEELPWWGFDGSSTRQAEGRSSDCMLKPVAVYPDSTKKNGVLVMCEVMMPDGKTPHPSNHRSTILDDPDAWFGFEQEYFMYQDGRPLGFPEHGYPAPQGPYYTGVGYKNVGSVAREIVEEHLDLCLEAGINHEGINAEVAKGQWEFQIFGKGSRTAADQIGGSDRQHALGRETAIRGGGERQQRSLRRLGHGRPVVQRGRSRVHRLLDPFGQEAQVARAAEQHDTTARGQRRLGDLGEGAHRPALFDEAGRRIARLGHSLDGPLCHRRGPGVFVHHLARSGDVFYVQGYDQSVFCLNCGHSL
mgnify:CR=1 FL=1